MRLIDADTIFNGEVLMVSDVAYDAVHAIIERINNAPTVDAVPLEDYKSMEQTVNKLTKAIADAEPVKHGRWQRERNPMRYQVVPYVFVCDQCGTAFEYDTPYCGECGAKMDEVEDG